MRVETGCIVNARQSPSSMNTMSGTTRWKCTLRRTGPPTRCTNVIAPVFGAPVLRASTTRRCHAPMARTIADPVRSRRVARNSQPQRLGIHVARDYAAAAPACGDTAAASALDQVHEDKIVHVHFESGEPR
jgi:hypothetical protein